MSKKTNDSSRVDSLMKELDAAIALLDAGEIDIEDALATYEHATGLVKLAAQKLAVIEQRVEALTTDDTNSANQLPSSVD